jgi:hypothetical protein
LHVLVFSSVLHVLPFTMVEFPPPLLSFLLYFCYLRGC